MVAASIRAWVILVQGHSLFFCVGGGGWQEPRYFQIASILSSLESFSHFLRAFFFVKINSWEGELVGLCLRKSYVWIKRMHHNKVHTLKAAFHCHASPFMFMSDPIHYEYHYHPENTCATCCFPS